MAVSCDIPDRRFTVIDCLFVGRGMQLRSRTCSVVSEGRRSLVYYLHASSRARSTQRRCVGDVRPPTTTFVLHTKRWEFLIVSSLRRHSSMPSNCSSIVRNRTAINSRPCQALRYSCDLRASTTANIQPLLAPLTSFLATANAFIASSPTAPLREQPFATPGTSELDTANVALGTEW